MRLIYISFDHEVGQLSEEVSDRRWDVIPIGAVSELPEDMNFLYPVIVHVLVVIQLTIQFVKHVLLLVLLRV